MRSHLGRALSLGVVVAVACAPGPTGLTPAQSAALGDSVRHTLEDLRRYSAAGNWDSMASLYDKDPAFRWVEEGKVVATAASQIGEKLHGLPAGMKLDNRFSGLEVAPLGPGSASVMTGFETTMVDPSGGKVSFGGTMTLVMVHRATGWKILTGHSSAAR